MNRFRLLVKTFAPLAPIRAHAAWTLVLPLVLLPLASTRLHGTEAAEQRSLQEYVDSLMRGRRGAVIVSNPVTGEILAVSNPRVAFERAFPPGSTAKIVASAVALEEGAISPGDHILCRRVLELLGEGYHCSHPPAIAPFTLTEALAQSCNYFFCALSARISSESLAHEYSLLGFGSPAEGLGSHAQPGRIHVGDSPAAKARAALGEGTILVTPAQLLLAYSALATRGLVFRLWKAPSPPDAAVLRQIKLKPATFDLLRSGLEGCVRFGTGQAAAVEGVRVAGKTGTAAALDGSRATHAWFVGFAPTVKPEIALVVLLERGTGARDAAPLAEKILNHYFAAKNGKP
ncbi:MAG: penicillin-binding transpeptidase domain-containing protein [Terriglobia bacterium]